MCGWVMRVGEMLVPVVGAMRKELLARLGIRITSALPLE
jgi:hypothetical protein